MDTKSDHSRNMKSSSQWTIDARMDPGGREDSLCVRVVFLLMAQAILTIACGTGAAEPSVTAEPTKLQPTEQTPIPSEPPTATSSPTPTSTWTPTSLPRATSTPVPLHDLSGGSVLGVSFLSGARLMVSLTFTESLDGEFRALVGGKDFACLILDQYPDRLYCIGPELPQGSEAFIEVLRIDFGEPVFEATFSVPLLPPTPGAVGGAIQFGGGLGNNYSPAQVTINVGDTVKWQGNFSVHPLVSDDGLWATVSGGSVFSFTFTSPGTFRFHCQVHEALGMSGQVTVSAP